MTLRSVASFATTLARDDSTCRAIVGVLQLGQHLAAVNGVSFFDVYCFQAAAQFGADLDVLRNGLDAARTGDELGQQDGSWPQPPRIRANGARRTPGTR